MTMRGTGGKQPVVVNLLDEVLEHLLGNGKVGDHAVLHGPDRGDIAGRAPQHLLGRQPDCLNDLFAVGPAILAYRDDRRLIQHDALAANVNQRIGGAQIDRHIGRKIALQYIIVYKIKHGLRNPLKMASDRKRAKRMRHSGGL